MHDLVVAFCTWLESTPWGAAIRLSAWMYPVVLWIHFVGLSVWMGTSLTLDLRLMGVGARRLTVAQLLNGLAAWNWIGCGLAVLAGFLLFCAEATTYIQNTGFNLKLAVAFPLALGWHVVVRTHAAAWSQTGQTSVIGKWAGLVEIVLWISVVVATEGFLLVNAVTHPAG